MSCCKRVFQRSRFADPQFPLAPIVMQKTRSMPSPQENMQKLSRSTMVNTVFQMHICPSVGNLYHNDLPQSLTTCLRLGQAALGKRFYSPYIRPGAASDIRACIVENGGYPHLRYCFHGVGDVGAPEANSGWCWGEQ